MTADHSVPFVSITNLSMVFPSDKEGLHALDDINLTINEHEFVCIIGPSGSGKSTLLRILADVLTPTKGSVTFSGDQDPTRAIVFQSSNLMPWMDVLHNIALPLKIRGASEKESLDRAQDWIKRVELAGFEKEWPKNLSGGMKQRVAIARALIQEPQLFLLDEPFGALDALSRDQMALELLKTWEQLHPTVLMVTHSITEAVLLADRVVVFSQRPGHIRYEMKIPFTRPRRGELRDEVEFIHTVKSLRDMIKMNKD